MDDRVELLVTVVVAADDEQAARHACGAFVDRVRGRVVASGDCSAEEPGCRSVTIGVASDEQVTYNAAAALARSVRRFVRELGPVFDTPRVACAPPTAWTVLDDPDALDDLVPGAERLLVEAWCGADAPATDAQPGPAEPVPAGRPAASTGSGQRLRLRVDVATDRPAGAEWQARALASRISGAVTLTSVTACDGGLRVHLEFDDLDAAVAEPRMVQTELINTAMAALDRAGWSTLSWRGAAASARWVAEPRPVAGITALELSAEPDRSAPVD